MFVSYFKTTSRIIFLLFLLVCGFHGVSLADTISSARRMCTNDALRTYKDAVQDAGFELRTAENSCRFGPIVATCMNTCFGTFKSCIEPVYQNLKSCRTTCATTLASTREALRNQFACGASCGANVEFQKGIIQANNAYYSCRIACRSSDVSVTARATCRSILSQCNKNCRN